MTAPTYQLHQGDCLQTLRAMPDASIDSVVTDPPYGLSQHTQAEVLQCLTAWIKGDVYQPKGKGFMGKGWDAWVPGPEVWRECLRVLKPGGHLLAFAGTRSMDLMCMSVRLAGFELRDAIGHAHGAGDPTQAPLLAWCYGSGFPKSMDVSKAIDREAGAERAVVGTYDTRGLQEPKKSGRTSGGITGNQTVHFHQGCDSKIVDITAPATEAAAQWQGWGTALKPAWEPIILARKPLAGTVAQNVQQHGTGALNIDGCRISGGGQTQHGGARTKAMHDGGLQVGVEDFQENPLGRWPANVILDGSPEVLAGFPDTGLSSGGLTLGVGSKTNPACWAFGDRLGAGAGGYGDTGSAARFFYTAKASAEDRDAGLHGFETAKTNDGRAVDADNAYQRGATLRANTHPTVKPTDLMRYLVRLVTPPGGTVLDCFNGSGSTGKAAVLEGFNYVGCELDPAYIEISRARIEYALALRASGADKLQPAAARDALTADLFAQ